MVYGLAAPADVTVRIVSLAGRLVATLDQGPKPAGAHSASWDGVDRTGHRAASGVYACEVEAGGVRLRTAMVILR